MVKERAEKVERLADVIPALEVDGSASGRLLVVGWGGTFGHLHAAVKQLGDAVSYVHFDFINPLPSNTEKVLSAFEKILVCELNCGQFATYLRGRFPHLNIHQFNKIQGQPFLVGELVEVIRKEME